MQFIKTSEAKQSWTDLLAQERPSLYNGSGVTSVTPSPQESDKEREEEADASATGAAQKPANKKGPKYKYFWYVMWVTRKRNEAAVSYFTEQGIKCWIPEVTRKEKVKGVVVEKRENLLFNKLFIYVKPSHLQSLRDKERNNPFLAYVRDRTKEKLGNDYPPMIIPRQEMENFQKLVSAHDEFMLEVKDKSKLTHKDEKNTYVVVEGKHAGLKGQRARYKKRDRIIVKCGTWVFATGYIQDAFLKVLESNIDESQSATEGKAKKDKPFVGKISDKDFDNLLNTVGATSPNIAFDSDRILQAEQVERWMHLRFPKKPGSQWYVLKTNDGHPVSSCFYLQEKGIPTFLPLCKKEVSQNDTLKYKWQPMSQEFIYAYASLDDISNAIQGTSIAFHYHSGNAFAPSCSPKYCVNDEIMRKFIFSSCNVKDYPPYLPFY